MMPTAWAGFGSLRRPNSAHGLMISARTGRKPEPSGSRGPVCPPFFPSINWATRFAKQHTVGTGKTTLMYAHKFASKIFVAYHTDCNIYRCRAISHFQDAPLVGVNFVSYYCHGSGSGPGPQYETIVRALCRRLAWKSDGSVADDAMRLYHSSKEVPDAQLTVKSTWEPLLHKLIASSPSTIVFILDALDECDSPGSYKDVLKFLARLPQQPNGPYMLVSSRPHVPVGVYLGASVQTFDVIHPETKNEMKNFIESQINSKMNDKEWEKSIFCE